MKNILFIFFTVFLFAGASFAQGKKQWIKSAETSIAAGDFYTASYYYKKALDIDSSDVAILFGYAESLRLINDYPKAAFYYNKSIKADNEKKFPAATFWLATMQKNSGQYMYAQKNFKKASNLFKKKDKNGYFYLKSIKEIESCGFAHEKMKQDTVKVTISNAGPLVNTNHTEFNAHKVGGDIYFSSLRMESESSRIEVGDNNHPVQLFVLPNSGGGPVPLNDIINAPGFHNGNGTFSPDGKSFYFSRCDSLSSCKIYVSGFEKGNFSNPIPLSDPVNIASASSTQPNATSIDGKEYLFFVSDRKGGEGRFDIWYSIKEGDRFLSAEPLDATINSIDDDVSPFYDSKTQTLYFSSSWHNGFGGYDIFKSNGKPKEFTMPENMGRPFNTSTNDLFFTIQENQKAGFLTSNRKGSFSAPEETCCNDIYTFSYPQDSVEVLDTVPKIYATLEELNKYLPVTLYFHNDEPNPRTTDTLTKKTYMQSYQEYVKLKDQYKKEYSKDLKGVEAQNAKDNIEAFFIDNAEKGVDDLEIFTSLLLDALKHGEHIEVTIKGYASPLAKSDYNLNLTKRRISSLINQLKEHENGLFLPYFNRTSEDGGKLTFVEIPFGSFKASKEVSSNLHDLKNSVYSRAAALERKIEILSVTLKEEEKPFEEENYSSDEDAPKMEFEESSYDFGKIPYGEPVEHSFKFKNTGNRELQIKEIIASCGCTAVDFPKDVIIPGDEAEIKIQYDTKGKFGPQENSVSIITNSTPKVITLNFSADVVLKK
jgi:hypothetical protein